MTDPTYVYESPDGGETVYRRIAGNHCRELHSLSEERQRVEQQLRREELWQGILDSAHDDAVLNEMLEQVESYYSLKHL